MERKKRMLLSLDTELHAILREISKETGKPSATIVYEILDQTRPHFRDMLEALKLAKAGSLEKARKQLLEMADNVTDVADTAKEDIKDVVEETKKLDNSD